MMYGKAKGKAVAFKLCKDCKTPAKCKAAGMCMAKQPSKKK